jgi:hypothetical protein
MSSTMGVNFRTVLPVHEPGRVHIKTLDPKPPLDQVEPFIQRITDQWSAARPTFIIDEMQIVATPAEVLGINVWYHVSPGAPHSDPAAPPLPVSFIFGVHELIAQEFPKEYVEAVIADTMKIVPFYQHRQDTLIAVNTRRIAVLLDEQTQRGLAIPADLVEQVLDGPKQERLQAWLAAPSTPYYVKHLAGSWFSDRNPAYLMPDDKPGHQGKPRVTAARHHDAVFTRNSRLPENQTPHRWRRNGAMLIFTKHGFYSAVSARQADSRHGQSIDPDRIMVRARLRSHLEALQRRFPDRLRTCDIREFAGTDYAYRLFVEKTVWSQVLAGLANEIDYDNFKSEVASLQGSAGAAYERSLHDVWPIMNRLQRNAAADS